MRIAITTFFQSQTNYGQLLQAFALQQVLMRMGHYPYIVRYGFHESLPLTLGMEFHQEFSSEKLLEKKQWELAEAGCAANRHFDDFRKNHLNLSKNAYNHLEELQLVPPVADCYLTGSDQVWAQLLSNTDNQTFFLNFGPENILRISYAPSFALKKYPSELNNLLTQNLKRFDAISVREKTGVDICKNAGTIAQWVVDPTMLLDGDYYRSLAKESQTALPANYMFVYHVNVKQQDFPYWNLFDSYNAEQGIRAVAVHANGENQMDVEFLDNAEYLYPSIQDWIRLIDGCQYVLTTSFHGMIFAILLHKPFFVGLRPESLFAGNDRIASILSELGLQDRIVTQDMDIRQIMQQSICWKEVDGKLEILRSSSLAFLEKNLKSSLEAQISHQQWAQFIVDKCTHYISQQLEEKEHQIVQMQRQMVLQQQQNTQQQQQILNLQEEKDFLQTNYNRVVYKKKKYLVIGLYLIVLLLVLIVLLVVLLVS